MINQLRPAAPHVWPRAATARREAQAALSPSRHTSTRSFSVEGESKAGNAVVEHGAVYAKFIFIEQQAGRSLDFRQIMPAKCFAGAEFADPIKSGAITNSAAMMTKSTDRASKRFKV